MSNIKKFLNLKRKYNLSFLLQPLVILSILSVIFYVLKLNGFYNADNIMLFCSLAIIVLSFERNNKKLKYVLIFLSFIIVLFLLYICIYDEFILFLADKCKNSGIKFGFLNVFFNTLGLNDFENLIYHTSYGGSKFISGNIVTGAIDIFKTKKGMGESSIFLCGKYLSLFSAVGIVLSLKENKKEILIITTFAVLTGNLNIYLLVLLLFYTPYYFLFLLFNFVSFFISNFLNINSGFYCNGSIFEMIIQKDNLVYIFALGILICAISYYCSRLVYEKFIC